MEELQKLYDVLVRDGYYTNDFETFISKWDDPEYKQKVYEVTSRDGLYTKDFESFTNKYQKKKIESDFISQDQSGELVTEDISSDIPVYDFETGGCRDGLASYGVNANQGAESTLAWQISLLKMYTVVGLHLDEQL